jgi:molybdate/tungstate transport system substrate-binding protein
MRRLHPLWTVLVAALALGAGLVAGFELHGSPSGAPSAGSGSSTLSVTAAGLLDGVFPAEASLLANETSGISTPTAAEQFEGSLTALEAISELHQPYDVAASADFRLIPLLLEPSYASWQVLFASSPLVLAYDAASPAMHGINSTNWPTVLTTPGVLLGLANASADPDGFNAIFALELEGLLTEGSLSALYDHFFTTPPGQLAVLNPATTRSVPETEAASLLSSGSIDAYFLYRAFAVSHHLSYLSLSPSVDLSNFSAAAIASYAQASTEILGPTGSLERVVGAPVAFTATVPANAPNATLGTLFVHLLLTPAGQALLAEQGFSPLEPALAQGTGLPDWIGPLTSPLPAGLAAELP